MESRHTIWPSMPDGADSPDRPGDDGPAILRSFLIADVRGYTRFTQERGDEEAARLAARFAQLARKGIEDHGGELLELRGDEALGVFSSAREALQAAVDLQRSFRERIDGESALPLGVGIGLDAGEAVPVEGGYRGGALNLAARLCSRAAPGEILASETIVSLARRIEGIRFEDRGIARLKGLEDPVKVIEVVPETPLPRAPVSRWSSLRRFRRKHVTRRKAWAATSVAVLAAATALLAVVALGGTSERADDPPRVALAGPFGANDPGPMRPQFREGLVRAARDFDLETEVIAFDEFDTSPKALDKVRARIEQGDFDLIISVSSPVAIALAGEVAKHPDTHFAYIDADLTDFRLEKAPNASAMLLLGGSGSFLAGYLAALMSKSGVISIVGGVPSAAENLVYWFEQGAKAARPDIDVRVDYSKTFGNQALCERIANRQIDAGSDVVFAAAGDCGQGALSAAGIRGVWGIGADRDQSDLGPHILASVVKRFDRAVELTVRQFLEGELPAGKTVNIGMREEVVGLVGINRAVPAGIRKKLAQRVAFVRKEEAKID